MSDYLAWLRRTFKDNNEQYHLRDEWQATVQGHRTVLEYASDLIYLAARIVPAKSQSEIKEHFRAGLSQRLQMKLAEHPEWDDLGLDDFIARADRQDQIEEAKDRVRYKTEKHETDRGRAYTITAAPRRGGRRPSSLTRRPRKGTQEWQTWCKTRDACFECGDAGHCIRNCPHRTTYHGTVSPGRSPSPFPRKGRSGSFTPRRSSSKSPSRDRNPSKKTVTFEEGKGKA